MTSVKCKEALSSCLVCLGRAYSMPVQDVCACAAFVLLGMPHTTLPQASCSRADARRPQQQQPLIISPCKKLPATRQVQDSNAMLRQQNSQRQQI